MPEGGQVRCAPAASGLIHWSVFIYRAARPASPPLAGKVRPRRPSSSGERGDPAPGWASPFARITKCLIAFAAVGSDDSLTEPFAAPAGATARGISSSSHGLSCWSGFASRRLMLSSVGSLWRPSEQRATACFSRVHHIASHLAHRVRSASLTFPLPVAGHATGDRRREAGLLQQ